MFPCCQGAEMCTECDRIGPKHDFRILKAGEYKRLTFRTVHFES